MWRPLILTLFLVVVVAADTPLGLGILPLPVPTLLNPLKKLDDLIRLGLEKRLGAKYPTAFITDHGYPVEEHKVTTGDGYILTLFRIPYGIKNTTLTRPGYPREPVLIQHGLMSSAMDFLVTGPERALGFILADAGYDVWLGNTRGSSYSRAHKELSPEGKPFWQFSWHEIGERDLPAMINFITNRSSYKKMHYIGHSQGTTAYFVMCNQRPEMQDKIMTMHALAPIAFMSNLRSPFVRFFAPFSNMVTRIYEFTTSGEFMPRNDLMRIAGYELCQIESPANQMCANAIYLAGGWGSDQIDGEQISDILSYSPASSSIFQLAHYGQEVNSGDFERFDFGLRSNMARYSTISPPEYDISRITSSVALHYSDNDWLAAVKDVDKFANKLPNMLGKFRVPDAKFNHMDFCWGKGAKEQVYDRVIDLMVHNAMGEEYIKAQTTVNVNDIDGESTGGGAEGSVIDEEQDVEEEPKYSAGWGID